VISLGRPRTCAAASGDGDVQNYVPIVVRVLMRCLRAAVAGRPACDQRPRPGKPSAAGNASAAVTSLYAGGNFIVALFASWMPIRTR